MQRGEERWPRIEACRSARLFGCAGFGQPSRRGAPSNMPPDSVDLRFSATEMRVLARKPESQMRKVKRSTVRPSSVAVRDEKDQQRFFQRSAAEPPSDDLPRELKSLATRVLLNRYWSTRAIRVSSSRLGSKRDKSTYIHTGRRRRRKLQESVSDQERRPKLPPFVDVPELALACLQCSRHWTCTCRLWQRRPISFSTSPQDRSNSPFLDIGKARTASQALPPPPLHQSRSYRPSPGLPLHPAWP